MPYWGIRSKLLTCLREMTEQRQLYPAQEWQFTVEKYICCNRFVLFVSTALQPLALCYHYLVVPGHRPRFQRWPAPLYNLYFDSFLLICTSFVVRTRGIVCVVYLLSRLANYDLCKRCVVPRFQEWIRC